MVALASWLLDNFHDANSLFSEATRSNPNNLEAQVLWGDLFLEKYNANDAQRSYQAVLDINSRHVPALVGMAKVGSKTVKWVSQGSMPMKAREECQVGLLLTKHVGVVGDRIMAEGPR